jgi:hypothetical protein
MGRIIRTFAEPQVRRLERCAGLSVLGTLSEKQTKANRSAICFDLLLHD